MKILHLEDNPHDAELFHALFREEWPECEIAVVDDRARFSFQLAQSPDLILSDFSMPQFSGLEALKLARVQRPDTPFLFLSGTIGEERAVEALRSGASDYIIKDRPQRLLAAIRRALKEAELARERRAAEEQFLRLQRLENIGLLASGIAHDFNNVLSPVLMAVSMLQTRHPEPIDQRLYASIEKSALRGTGLVKQILTFVHGRSTSPELINVAALTEEMAAVIEHTFPKSIKVRCESSPGLPQITANPTQVHQVLLNLCVNARDAMPDGGTLVLRTSHATLSATADLADGDYVLIEVSDTGTGIPPEVAEKIWDPFFTTKGEGQGSGLGLSTVRGIVKNHGGTITLHTEAGKGTSFQVWLPVVASRLAIAETGDRRPEG